MLKCAEKGANLIRGAVKKGLLATEAANPKGLEIRGKVEGAMLKLGEKWRKKDLKGSAPGRTGEEDHDRDLAVHQVLTQCIPDQCPICYCVECTTKNPVDVPPGDLPLSFMFHLIRYAHIADSCVNCGQCEELALGDSNALFMHAQQVELEKMFGHVPGVNMELPLMAYVEETGTCTACKHRHRYDYENVFNPVVKK